MEELNCENARQQKHLTGLKQAQIGGQKQLGKDQPVFIVLLPQPGGRERISTGSRHENLYPSI
jgi:hypothetical protein